MTTAIFIYLGRKYLHQQDELKIQKQGDCDSEPTKFGSAGNNPYTNQRDRQWSPYCSGSDDMKDSPPSRLLALSTPLSHLLAPVYPTQESIMDCSGCCRLFTSWSKRPVIDLSRSSGGGVSIGQLTSPHICYFIIGCVQVYLYLEHQPRR